MSSRCYALLFLVQELGVTDDVDEQDMPDLQLEIVVGFRRHEPFLTRRPLSAYLFLTAEQTTRGAFKHFSPKPSRGAQMRCICIITQVECRT
jgi:hypothetical protein